MDAELKPCPFCSELVDLGRRLREQTDLLDNLYPGLVLGQWDIAGYDDDHRWAVWEVNEAEIYYFGRTPQEAIENAIQKRRPEGHP